MKKFFDLFHKRSDSDQIKRQKSIFIQKYQRFKQLLAANNRALSIIADLEDILYQDKPFTFVHGVAQIESLIQETTTIAKVLYTLSGNKYAEIVDVTDTISTKILKDLFRKRKLEETHLVLPIDRLSRENIADVGGKAANLGEIANRAHLPVPPGFAITAYAYQQFLEFNELTDWIEGRLKNVNIDDTQHIVKVGSHIQERLMGAQLQPDLEQSIGRAAQELTEKFGPSIRFAVRSSATSEDTDASFAGQHSTILNVADKNLIHAYKQVASSIFNPRAIFYRRSKGYHDQDVLMSVACIVMIDALVSGVMYTIDPNDSRNSVIMISAVWGLAAMAVEGSMPTDFFQIQKNTGSLKASQIVSKKVQWRCDPDEGLVEEAVSDELQDAACLNQEQLNQLKDYGLQLESHYGYALDIEWAIDHQNKIYILQARPLKRYRRSQEPAPAEKPDDGAAAMDHPVIVQGGAAACEGTAAGPAYIITSEHLLHHIPEGVIVVARQTSPRYVPLMNRIKGFITDVGSVTGHMASVAREFHLPTLVGTENATQVIPNGEKITLDATRKTVYLGTVEHLIADNKPLNPMTDSPIYHTMKSVLKKVAPLNLTDPSKDDFTARNCRTLHDVIRFCHEMAMHEMFHITDQVRPESTFALPLRAYIPLKMTVIDLGNGVRLKPGNKFAEVDDIQSIPFRALLRGFKHEDVDWHRDVGINIRGLTSILAETVIRDPTKEGRLGEPCYAMVAGHYLNFNSRMGYHFATIDTYCGESVNDNYITIYFKGGAADIGRRSRRALLIARILKRLGFKVEQKADMVRGEIKKYPSPTLEDKLDFIGRMLGSVRLLDMLLSEEGQVQWYEEQFFKGNYRFEPEKTDGGATKDRL
ncbi:MAG: hypothetical protein AMJ54_03430 [Deltaproteobacteria bacterium SG8_13]|nr:MAG: hypothetical protein AMJ54_03430 [Deltaproteobacteria bacterium SG8_13]